MLVFWDVYTFSVSLYIQTPFEEVFESLNISFFEGFLRGSKHLLTWYLEDFGCLRLQSKLNYNNF